VFAERIAAAAKETAVGSLADDQEAPATLRAHFVGSGGAVSIDDRQIQVARKFGDEDRFLSCHRHQGYGLPGAGQGDVEEAAFLGELEVLAAGQRIGISNDISRELALFSPYFERSTARSQAINPPLH
jgi:hypothetical protein